MDDEIELQEEHNGDASTAVAEDNDSFVDDEDDHIYQNRPVPVDEDAGGAAADHDYENVSKVKMPEDRRNKETLHFQHDPSKRIDYVIAYKDVKEHDKMRKREIFEANLKKEGLELELTDKVESVEGQMYYLLVSAPWEVLLTGAEFMNMKKRIKMPKELPSGLSCSWLDPFQVSEKIVPEEDDFFTAPFNRMTIEMFDIDENNQDAFFTNAERSLIVRSVMDRTYFTPESDSEARFGISRLIDEKVYTSAFPLHEKRCKPEADDTVPWGGDDKDRARLYEAWARPGRFLCYQPLDLIRKYFGEKIAIYFAWLGFYTAMLIPASILGLAAFVYGCATLMTNDPSEEICNDSVDGQVPMCPLCDKRCNFWYLHDSCLYARITYLFDNFATVVFAAFMAMWATCFLEFWKRKQKELEYEWDVADFELDERMRPEFEFKVKKHKTNPITEIREPYIPFFSQICRGTGAYTMVIFMITLVLAAIFGIIVYRIIIVALMYQLDNAPIKQNAKLLTSLTAAVINLIIIMILNLIYRNLIVKPLTDMEMHRTNTEYEDSFTFKMFLFQFVNFYGSIFYIAFFKGRFISRPGSEQYYLFGEYKQDECDPAGCLIELSIQLAIVMVGKQAINNFKELGLPWLVKACKTRSSKKLETEENLYMRWEQDEDLVELPELGLFEEYLEMVIQFGFVTIFVAAFPLAPLCALINNIIEIRLDAWKFVALWRRPPAAKAQDIGAWFGILTGLAFIAVLSNGFIIAFTSDFVPKLVYRFGYSDDKNLVGFVNDSLSYFRISDFTVDQRPDENLTEFAGLEFCRYRDYRYPPDHEDPYEYSLQHWHVLTARLAFVIVFEHICFLFTWALAYAIPDVSGGVRRLMVYERQLIRKLNFDATFGKKRKEE